MNIKNKEIKEIVDTVIELMKDKKLKDIVILNVQKLTTIIF